MVSPPVEPPPSVVLGGPDHVRAGEPFSLDLHVPSTVADHGYVLHRHRGTAPRRATAAQGTMSLVAGDNHKGFPDDRTQAVASRLYGPRQVRSGTCTLMISRRLCRLRRSAAAGAAGRKPAGAGRTSQKGPGRRECRGRSPAGTARAAQLAAYDLIILSNVPAAALPEPRMKALQTYVRDDRGGLIVVGGDHSFTARRLSSHHAGRDPAGDLRRAEEQAQADPGDGPGAGHLRFHERPVRQPEVPQHRPGQGGPADGRQHARAAGPGGRAGLRRPQPLDLAAGARDRQSRRSSPRSTPSRPKAARTCTRRWSRPIWRSARPLPT